ncbi:hypothetical protein HDV05_007044, partial [Chytridiales sp. JEL 0842]
MPKNTKFKVVNAKKDVPSKPVNPQIDIFEPLLRLRKDSTSHSFNTLTSSDIQAQIASRLSIHVFAWKRAKSLNRLLKSLKDADYGDVRNLEMIIHVDGGATDEVLELASNYSWPFGPKDLVLDASNVGLQEMMTAAWIPKSDDELAIFLEDDIELSPLYFDYIKWCIKVFFTPGQKSIDAIVGCSLYTPRLNEISPTSDPQNPPQWLPSNVLVAGVKLIMGLSIDTVGVPLHNLASHPILGPAFILGSGLVLYQYIDIIFWTLTAAFAALPILTHLLRLADPAKVINWSEEIIVITGGSHGVGLSLVQKLQAKHRPKKIVVLDLNPIDSKDENVTFIKCDVSNREEVMNVASRIIKDVGQPTMLVNNAGIVNGRTFLNTAETQIDKVIGVNLMGPIWLMKAFLPGMMEKNHGHIVNVASVMAYVGASNMTDYCASKSGLMGFHEALRQEIRHTKVRLTAVFPGLIHTGMFKGVEYSMNWLTRPLETQEVSEAILQALIKNRHGEVKLPFFTVLTPAVRMLAPEISDAIKDKFRKDPIVDEQDPFRYYFQSLKFDFTKNIAADYHSKRAAAAAADEHARHRTHYHRSTESTRNQIVWLACHLSLLHQRISNSTNDDFKIGILTSDILPETGEYVAKIVIDALLSLKRDDKPWFTADQILVLGRRDNLVEALSDQAKGVKILAEWEDDKE